MCRSDWGIVFAIGGCLALAGLGLNASEERRYNEERANSSRQQTDQIDRNRAGIPALAESYISNPDPKEATETERRDLAAQEASAVWSFWVVVVSFAGTAVTAIGTILLYEQIKLTREAVKDTGDATKEMRESNRIAVETSGRQLRPYVQIEKIEPEEASPSIAEICVILKNFGQTPASKIRVAFSWCYCPNTQDRWSIPDAEIAVGRDMAPGHIQRAHIAPQGSWEKEAAYVHEGLGEFRVVLVVKYSGYGIDGDDFIRALIRFGSKGPHVAVAEMQGPVINT
ncbi:hypothetical protein NYR55_10575 [Sphingomonas sp. BGYR3]|uniref:hypothetical protein n=1 Tax=Sphingomonas sp. BGYR3 TaxID=2975483 RepID=UPI0021A8B063|nr:hypothetical protein [Sphingomonas sp. BGYR3]MDG5489056.1 hypothetical protein [Sphingomonas sp. BGYR3]